MWSFPLWTLPKVPKKKGVALGCKGGEGTRRPFSIHRGMGGWDTLQWLLFWAPSLAAEEVIPAALLPVTIRPCLVASLLTNAWKGRRP